MKRTLFVFIELIIIASAIVSCSDDSDKLEEFYEQKNERIKKPAITYIHYDGSFYNHTLCLRFDVIENQLPVKIYYSKANTWPTTLLYEGTLTVYDTHYYGEKGIVHSHWSLNLEYEYFDNSIYLDSGKTYYFRVEVNGISSEVKSYTPSYK